MAAAWKWQNCGALCNHIFGFDTFTGTLHEAAAGLSALQCLSGDAFMSHVGLPEAWKRIETDGPMDSWPAGTFDLQGSMPQVLGNVYLWQGLFADTLPAYLNMSRAFGQYGPATYVHMDCDIYSGKAAPMLLDTCTGCCQAQSRPLFVLQALRTSCSYSQTGCKLGLSSCLMTLSIMLRTGEASLKPCGSGKHQLLACQDKRCRSHSLRLVMRMQQRHTACAVHACLHAPLHAAPASDAASPDRLQASGIKLATLGIFGPLEGTSEAMQLTVDSEHHWFHQSVAFVVAEKPQTPMKPWKDLSDAEATGRSLTGATDGHAGHLQVGKSLSSLTTTGSREAAGIGNVLSVASSGKAQPKDAIPHATTPSSQTKVVDGQHFNIPGTEHAAGSHQSTSKDAGAEPAGRSHRTTGNQRVSLRSHVGSQGSHRHKHFSR